MTLTKRQRRKALRRLPVPHYQEGGSISPWGGFDWLTDIINPPPPTTPGYHEEQLPSGMIALIDDYDGSVQDTYWPRSGQGGGGGTSYSVSDIGPVSADIQRQRDLMDQQLGFLNAEIEREQLAAQQAIAAGDLAEERRHNEAIEQLQIGQLWLTTQRDNLDRELAYRAQDIAQRGQDIDWAQAQMDYQLGRVNAQTGLWGMALKDAIDRGQLALTGRGQDVGQRGQDLDAQISYNTALIDSYGAQITQARDQGQYELAAALEERMRASMQQQVVLEGYRAELEGVGLGGQFQQGAMGGLTDLAGIEQTRQARLQNLAANPRDFIEYLTAQGEGVPFYEALSRGEHFVPGGGFSGDSLLGAGFDRLVDELSDTPAYDSAYQAALRLQEMASEVPQAPERDYLLSFGENLPPLPEAPAYIPPPEIVQPSAPPVAPVAPSPSPPSPYAYTPQSAEDAVQQAIQSALGIAAPGAGVPYSSTQVGADIPFAEEQIAASQPGGPPVPLSMAARLIAASKAGTSLVGTTNYGAVLPEEPEPIPPVPMAGGGNVYSQILARWRKLTGKRPMGKQHLVLDEPAVLMGMDSGRALATMGERAPQERETITPFAGGWNIQPMR